MNEMYYDGLTFATYSQTRIIRRKNTRKFYDEVSSATNCRFTGINESGF